MAPATQHAPDVCPAVPPSPVGAANDGRAGLAEEVNLDEGALRFTGYAGRLGQLARAAERVSSIRHLAYASDVGEAARPVVPRWMVNCTYGLSVGYCAADVVAKGVKASDSGASSAEVTRLCSQTAVFQGLASIGAPFVAIHSQVHLFQKLLRNTAAAKHGPTVAGLALIPLLPLVDHPIEHAVEQAFESLWPAPGSGHAKQH
jgi:fission process protein 1